VALKSKNSPSCSTLRKGLRSEGWRGLVDRGLTRTVGVSRDHDHGIAEVLTRPRNSVIMIGCGYLCIVTTGVGAELTRATGAAVSSVRELEHQAYDIATAVGVHDAEVQGITPVLREARRQVREGLPPWTQELAPESVLSWLDDALAIFDLRNALVHWQELHRFDGSHWVPVMRSSRTRAVRAALTADDVDSLASRAEACRLAGSAMWRALVFEVRPGIYCWNPNLAPVGLLHLISIFQQGDDYPTISDEEFEHWWANFWATAPAEWASWPTDRHLKQQKKPRRVTLAPNVMALLAARFGEVEGHETLVNEILMAVLSGSADGRTSPPG
jgi:hypothetical protein